MAPPAFSSGGHLLRRFEVETSPGRFGAGNVLAPTAATVRRTVWDATPRTESDQQAENSVEIAR